MAKDTWQVFWNLGAGCMMAAGRTAFHNIGDKVKESHKSVHFSLLAKMQNKSSCMPQQTPRVNF